MIRVVFDTVVFVRMLKRKYRTTTDRGMDQLLQIISRSTVVEADEIAAVSRDPKDNHVMATAKAAAADYLVSEHQDLLVLNEDESTTIVTCGTFVRLLEASPE